MKKKRIKKLSDKIVTKIFVERLDEFIAMWHREAPENTFDEFLLSVEMGSEKLSKVNGAMFKAFQRSIAVMVDMWKGADTEKSFDEYLCDGRSRLHENKKNKKGGNRQ